ncbi:MAG: GNAT family N-acetyltransferase [Planctomycetaceae bacterium]|nr:GNAT family N-acetyltransferase [Planctomycetaceae bacterium]
MARKALARKNTRRLGSISRSFQKARKRRQERRLLTDLEFAFADRLEFLNESHWDEVARHGSIFLDRRYLTTLAESGLQDVSFRYGLIYRTRQPVACFAMQTVDIAGDQLVRADDQLTEEEQRKFSKQVTRRALKRAHRRVTVCGNLVSWGMDGFAFDPYQPAAEMWKALSEALYRLRRADKLYGQADYVMVKDLVAASQEDSSAFEAHSYRAVETEPNMVLEMDPSWKTFYDYLASLNKKYRKAAKTVDKTLKSAGAVIATLDELSPHRDELHSMYVDVARRADVRLASLSADFLPSLQGKLGSELFATHTINSADGKLLGYVTILRDGDTAVGYYLGLDYDSNEKLPIYHRLLFLVIEQAIEWGCQRISFGRTALEAKSRLGCQPEQTFVWVRHRIPLLNAVVRQLLKAVPHAEPPERNPFKSV